MKTIIIKINSSTDPKLLIVGHEHETLPFTAKISCLIFPPSKFILQKVLIGIELKIHLN